MTEGVAEAKTRHAGDLSEAASEWDAPTGRNIIVAIGINQYQHQSHQIPDDVTPNLSDLEAIKAADFRAIEAAFADR